MSTLALSSPHPSAVCLAHLHLELSLIILQLLLLFLVIVIAVGGLADHTKEAGVTDIKVVVTDIKAVASQDFFSCRTSPSP